MFLDKNGEPTGTVHFGYRDGIAQPWVAGGGGLGKKRPVDLQPDMPTGDLLLGCGYENSFGGNYAGVGMAFAVVPPACMPSRIPEPSSPVVPSGRTPT